VLGGCFCEFYTRLNQRRLPGQGCVPCAGIYTGTEYAMLSLLFPGKN